MIVSGLLRRRGIVVNVDYVDHREAIARMRSADVLLLLNDGTNIPGKAFEFSGEILNEFGQKSEKRGRHSPGAKLEFATGRKAQVVVETFSGKVELRKR